MRLLLASLLAVAILTGCTPWSRPAGGFRTTQLHGPGRGHALFHLVPARAQLARCCALERHRAATVPDPAGSAYPLVAAAGGHAHHAATHRDAPPTTPTTTPPRIAQDNRIRFRWPTDGEVVARFTDEHAAGKGITISGRVGQPVVAAAPGRVVYTGSGLVGYGALIIVKHNDQLLSAYAHNREILVSEGDDVGVGQRIATMGEGPGRRAMLHFEIRVDGQAVDPMQHLPPR
jgi:lipoprotein NlpD